MGESLISTWRFFANNQPQPFYNTPTTTTVDELRMGDGHCAHTHKTVCLNVSSLLYYTNQRSGHSGEVTVCAPLISPSMRGYVPSRACCSCTSPNTMASSFARSLSGNGNECQIEDVRKQRIQMDEVVKRQMMAQQETNTMNTSEISLPRV